jgi:chromosome partitioning protein
MAGDGLLVPVEASPKGLQALPTVLAVARDYAEGLASLGMWGGTSFVRALFPNGLEGTVRDREVLAQLEALAGRVPLAPPLVRRPAVYREAQVQRLPVQAVGGEEVRREMRALGDFLEGILEGVRADLPKEVAP